MARSASRGNALVAMNPRSRAEALALLHRFRAPPRLLRHVDLVGEAADELLEGLGKLGVPMDATLVRVGVVLHDAGKVLHPAELDAPGAAHEPAGERLLLEHGVATAVARVCRSHAQWSELPTSLDELAITLADKLWKGARHRDLEERVIDRAAAALGRDRWDVFTALDGLFEDVAASGQQRLARSLT